MLEIKGRTVVFLSILPMGLWGRIGETFLPSFLRWQSISSWSVFCSLSWINGRVDGRNDSNQTTKLAVVFVVVGSERTQIVWFSHI